MGADKYLRIFLFIIYVWIKYILSNLNNNYRVSIYYYINQLINVMLPKWNFGNLTPKIINISKTFH